MDDRAQELERIPSGGDRHDDPPLHVSEPLAAAEPSGGSAQPGTSTPPAPAQFLPLAAGGGAGGVAVRVILLAVEPARTEAASDPVAAPAVSEAVADPRPAPEAPAPEGPPATSSPALAEATGSALAETTGPALEEIAGSALVEATGSALAEAKSEPALLAQIPAVAFARPKLAAPPPVVPVLRRIEPEPILPREPSPPPSPAVVETAEPGIILPPSPPFVRPPPRREAAEVSRGRLRRAAAMAGATVAGLIALVLVLAALYRWVDPPASTLMLGQWLAGTSITRQWMPLQRISPNLLTAVIVSEDSHFCRHRGVDWAGLKEAMESAGDGMARGGSTISMQVVKNLFLWPSRSYVRKALEIPLALVIEALWPKHRVLEIYLNIAEWGPGVFGAEAAARYHFRKPALLLTPREAALLAVSLPNPFERQAGRPGPGTQRLADRLLLRMRGAGASAACVRAAAG